ncbi:MAG: hypothetical protein ACKOFP_14165 [Actinomycetota bacterium]
MEVLEQGQPDERVRSSRRPLIAAVVALVAVVILASALVAGWRWWSQQDPRSYGLEISAVEVIGRASVTVEDGDSGWAGGLGTPGGAVAPAVWARLTVEGDPRASVVVSPAPASPEVIVSAVVPTAIPAGQTVNADVVLAPSDCLTAGALPRELLVASEGTVVPIAESVRDEVAQLMVRLCSAGGQAPVLEPTSALIDVFFRDRTLVITADVQSRAERVVLTPLDGTALRGLGAQDLDPPGERSVRLRWLISPGEMSPNTSLTGRVQAYSIIDGTAYPWILVVPISRDVAVQTSSASLISPRNDGVDLAEVAPRPSN